MWRIVVYGLAGIIILAWIAMQGLYWLADRGNDYLPDWWEPEEEE